MQRIITILCVAMLATVFNSCSDDDVKPSDATGGTLVFEFDTRYGTQNFKLNSTYQNALGQDFTPDVLRYYISNIKLKRADGTFYEDPLSQDGSKGYYLVDEANEASTFITLQGVPFNKYEGAEFTIGVDAGRVSQGAQTGALDPVNKLFWSWNAGYIFVQIEGTSPQSNEVGNIFMYHIGGYKADNANPNLANNIKVKSITFGGDEADVSATSEPEIHIIVDVKKFFEGTTNIDFSANGQCHVPSCGSPIADNYVNTFIFDHLHQ